MTWIWPSMASLKRIWTEFFPGVWKMSGFLSENPPVQTLRSILERLEQAYCGTVGYEYMHIPDREKCNWLRERIETVNPREYSRERSAVILDRLTWSTVFENFLATKWKAAKRFGLEGGETLIPGMKEMFDRAADLGVKSIVIGMPHRGRLNVLGRGRRSVYSYWGCEVSFRPTRGGKRINPPIVGC